MKNLIQLLLLLSIFMISCDQNKGKIVVGVDTTYPPFSYLGGERGNEVVGLDMAIMKEIAIDSNKEVVIKIMPLDEIIPAIKSGDIDVAMPALTINEERRQRVNFSSPSFWDTPVVLVRKDDVTFDNIRTKEELGATKVMGAPRGTFVEPLTHDIADDEHIVKFDTFDETVQALLNNEIDAILIDRISGQAFISLYGTENLETLSMNFETIYYGFAIKKGNKRLLDDINKTLKRIIDSGEYVRLVEEHISGYKAD